MSSVTSPQTISAGQSPATRGNHHQRLARLGARERQRRQMIVAASVVGIVLLLAACLAALDFVFELSSSARLVGWVVIATAVAGFIAACWRWMDVQTVEAVHRAEQVWPELGQRLRTSHDYQSSPASV